MRLTYPRLCLLVGSLLTACSEDTTHRPGDDGGQALDAGVSDATASGMDAQLGLDARTPDAHVNPNDIRPDGAICAALGCDELGYECGQTVDNCGDPLNCNLAANQTPCVSPERCGGDPDLGEHKCGCKPRDNACAAVGATCGMIDECGMELSCGACANGSVCLNNKCSCSMSSDPCVGKVCGSAVDGCGNTVMCGPNAGGCTSGLCDATGQCTCPPSTQVCAGQTGTVMQNGCTYECSPGGCVADNVTACAGAECGTARNNCGDTVQCGAAAGACAGGNSCIGPQFVVDSALPAQSANFQGGYCVAPQVAQIIGKYAVRTHAFREAGTTSINFINRAEAVSLVTIQYSRALGGPQLTDQACVASTIGDPSQLSGGGTKSIVPNYRNLKAVTINLGLSGSTFVRGDVANAVLGSGSPAGYVPGIPDFCVGFEGQDVDLPAGDSRRGKWWADNRCTCPTAAAPLPAKPNSADPNNYSTAVLRDCRIVDDDLDGKAGFTAKASALGIINSELYNANVSHGIWTVGIRADRYHVGFASEAVTPLQRVVIGCLATGGACAPPGVDCGCSNRWSTVQFVPLADSAAIDCTQFYTSPGTASEAINQTAIDQTFSVGFGSCNGPAQCPVGSICHGNRCFPQTSKGACTSGSTNPCPAGTYCEACPDDAASTEVETSCRSDATCWPTSQECPVAGSGIGGYCVATPP